MSSFKVGDAVEVIDVGWVAEFGADYGRVAWADSESGKAYVQFPDMEEAKFSFHESELMLVNHDSLKLGGGLCIPKL